MNAVGGGELCQRARVAGAVTTEVEVVAHVNLTRMQTIDQQRFDESFRAKVCELRVESRGNDDVRTRTGEELHTLGGRGDAKVVRIDIPEHRLWMRLEGQHRGGDTEGIRFGAHLRKDGAMAVMYAIEVADRQHTTTREAGVTKVVEEVVLVYHAGLAMEHFRSTKRGVLTMVADIVLLGDPVAHSKSPVFQNAGLEALGLAHRYGVRQVDSAGLKQAVREIRRGTLLGANVTVPHKGLAFAQVEARTTRAEKTQAVNTLWRADGQVWGDNTDVAGIEASLKVVGVSTRRSSAVVFGAGGAAAAAVLGLGDWFETIVVCNRTVARAETLCAALADACTATLLAAPWTPRMSLELATTSVVVNATSLELGAASVAQSAWESVELGSCGASAWLDLSYSPDCTRFLRYAPTQVVRSGRARDGATMLLHQGAASFERWTGHAAPLREMRDALTAALGRDQL